MRTHSFRAICIFAFALCLSPIAALSMSQKEIAPWLASTTMLLFSAHGPDSSIALHYVRVRGTKQEGYLLTESATHGFLENGQEVVAVPIGSGGTMGVNAALVFTRVNGARRFVGYLPGPSGHLEVAIREGRLEQSTPLYEEGDPNCCASQHRIETFTLRGIRLIKLSERVVRGQP